MTDDPISAAVPSNVEGTPTGGGPRCRRWLWVLLGAVGVLLVMFVFAFLRSGETMKPEDFAQNTPSFVPEAFFSGRTLAWGLFQDRSGTLRRQFQMDIDGTWNGKTLTLTESLLYDDGERNRRVWHLIPIGEHTYEGHGDDIVGVARGETAGNALHWTYDLSLPIGKNTVTVRFSDWMWLQPGGVVMGRATVSKWGATLGTVTLAFRKGAPGESLTMGDETAPAVPKALPTAVPDQTDENRTGGRPGDDQ